MCVEGGRGRGRTVGLPSVKFVVFDGGNVECEGRQQWRYKGLPDQDGKQYYFVNA